jgi:hypothetical protein
MDESMNRNGKHGFTLVEAVIVAVVIVVILAVTIPWMRERERQRLQTLADTEPWEVFEFRAKPAKDLFSAEEEIVIECEIENMTNQLLMLPADISTINITLGTEPWIIIVHSDPYGRATRNDAISEILLAPGEVAEFSVKHAPFAEGGFDARITMWLGDVLYEEEDTFSARPSPLFLERHAHFISDEFRIEVEVSGDPIAKNISDYFSRKLQHGTP